MREMSKEEQERFEGLLEQLEWLDDECRSYQKTEKNNPYYAMISDAKSTSILVSESYKHYLEAKKTEASVSFYEVMLDLLEAKVHVLTVMVLRQGARK